MSTKSAASATKAKQKSAKPDKKPRGPRMNFNVLKADTTIEKWIERISTFSARPKDYQWIEAIKRFRWSKVQPYIREGEFSSDYGLSVIFEIGEWATSFEAYLAGIHPPPCAVPGYIQCKLVEKFGMEAFNSFYDDNLPAREKDGLLAASIEFEPRNVLKFVNSSWHSNCFVRALKFDNSLFDEFDLETQYGVALSVFKTWPRAIRFVYAQDLKVEDVVEAYADETHPGACSITDIPRKFQKEAWESAPHRSDYEVVRKLLRL